MRDERFECVALMQKDGQARLGGQFELHLECSLLSRAWREIAKEIEAALAYRNDFGVGEQRSVRTRTLAGYATLELAEPRRIEFVQVKLTAPLERTC